MRRIGGGMVLSCISYLHVPSLKSGSWDQPYSLTTCSLKNEECENAFFNIFSVASSSFQIWAFLPIHALYWIVSNYIIDLTQGGEKCQKVPNLRGGILFHSLTISREKDGFAKLDTALIPQMYYFSFKGRVLHGSTDRRTSRQARIGRN